MSIARSNTGKNIPLSLAYTRQRSMPAIKRKPMRRPISEKVALPTMEGIHFEEVKNIISLEAQGNYTMLLLDNKRKILVCKTLREMEELIRSEAFVRIHRSYTINLNKLAKYIKGKGGYVVMDDGSHVNVSAGRKKEFMEALEFFF
jgi:two-component system LytT family response regulator